MTSSSAKLSTIDKENLDELKIEFSLINKKLIYIPDNQWTREDASKENESAFWFKEIDTDYFKPLPGVIKKQLTQCFIAGCYIERSTSKNFDQTFTSFTQPRIRQPYCQMMAIDLINIPAIPDKADAPTFEKDYISYLLADQTVKARKDFFAKHGITYILHFDILKILKSIQNYLQDDIR